MKSILALLAILLSGCLESAKLMEANKPAQTDSIPKKPDAPDTLVLSGTEYLDEGGEMKFRYLDDSHLYRDTVSSWASVATDYYYLWNLGGVCTASLNVDTDSSITEDDSDYLQIAQNRFGHRADSVLSKERIEVNDFKDVAKVAAIVNAYSGPHGRPSYERYQTEMYFFKGMKRGYFLAISGQPSIFESSCREAINWYLGNIQRQ